MSPWSNRWRLLPRSFDNPGSGRQESEHGLRARVLAILRTRRGLSIGNLRAELQVGWSTLYHHLERMRQERSIDIVTQGRHSFVFLAGDVPSQEELEARAVLANDAARLLARETLAHPGISVPELAIASAKPTRVVYYHVRRLLDAGLLQSNSRTRHFGLRATPLLQRLLQQAEEAP